MSGPATCREKAKGVELVSIVPKHLLRAMGRALSGRAEENLEVRAQAPQPVEGETGRRNHGVGGTGLLANPIPELE